MPKRREDVEAGMARAAATPEEALRQQPAALEVDLDEPLYTVRDAEVALDRFSAIAYDEEREVAPGVFATFLDAGHILGSAIIRLRVQDGEGRGGRHERTIVFSGDLGRCDTPIIRDPTVLTHADYVVVESTYGGREHEPQEEAIRILADTVRLVAEHDGVLLVPELRDRAHAGDRLAARPAARAGRDPGAAALPRFADGDERERHLPQVHRLLRRGDRAPPARARDAARLSRAR